MNSPLTPTRRPSRLAKTNSPFFKSSMTFSPLTEGHAGSFLETDNRDLEAKEALDGNDDDKENIEQEPLGCLESELRKRNKERDDLQYALKVMKTKYKNYQQKLESRENDKKQQMKMLAKTYDLQLKAKDATIQSLSDVIQELRSAPGRDLENMEPWKRLLGELREAQDAHAQARDALAQEQAQYSELQNKHAEAIESLEKRNEESGKELRNLRDEIVHLQRCKNSLEADRRKLQQQALDACDVIRTEYANEDARPEQMVEEQTVKREQKLELAKLKQLLKTQQVDHEAALKEARRHGNEAQCALERLSSENAVHARHARELGAQLALSQAQLPQMVTRVERIEVAKSDVIIELKAVKAKNKELEELLEREREERGAVRSKQETAAKALRKSLEREKKAVCQLEKELKNAKETVKQLQEKADGPIANDVIVQQTREISRIRAEFEQKLKSAADASKVEHAVLLHHIIPAFKCLRREYDATKSAFHQYRETTTQLLLQCQNEASAAASSVAKQHRELAEKYRQEMRLRKKLNNELVDLKGNIRVFCRVRPAVKEDCGSATVVTFDDVDGGVVNVQHKGRSQQYDLDSVFRPDATQKDVFAEVQSLVTSCIDGYNICIFAYGQTGSGKTYTMEGSRDNPGINERALAALFAETESRSSEFRFGISVCMLEIYNEQVRDLLSADPSAKLEARTDSTGNIYVPGLIQLEVTSHDDVRKVFEVGQENRQTAATNMNERSSRSHVILSVSVRGKCLTTGSVSIGKLNLVDLAGSERVSKSGADGARLREAQNINKSLSALGDVIQALRSRRDHIPYRNSKLTYLLQDSLGGDSKTLMIVQVAPVDRHVNETVASLSFAARVRAVAMGTASKQVENMELQELRERLAEYEESTLTREPLRSSAKKPRK